MRLVADRGPTTENVTSQVQIVAPVCHNRSPADKTRIVELSEIEMGEGVSLHEEFHVSVAVWVSAVV